MTEQTFIRKCAGRYENKDYRIEKNYTSDTWTIIRKSDKKRAFAPTLKRAKEFIDSVGVTDERNWSL